MENEVLDVALTKKKYESNKRFNDKTYDRINCVVRKEERMKEMLELAAQKNAKSVSTYIVEAIQARLQSDGITIDMLPADAKYAPPEPEPKQPKRYMIYMITETYMPVGGIVEDKYIATFPTLKAAEKYARNKFKKKAYPRDWCYQILGRYVEGENQLDACNKLKAKIKEELEIDKSNGIVDGVAEDQLNYLDRLVDFSGQEYIDTILCDDPDAKSQFDIDEDEGGSDNDF